MMLKEMKNKDLLQLAAKTSADEKTLIVRGLYLYCEIARRKLYGREGFDSLFVYLAKGLGLSKASAYQRSTIAKAAIKDPEIIKAVEDKKLTMESATLVAKKLLQGARNDVIEQAFYKDKDELELLFLDDEAKPMFKDSFKIVGVLEGKKDKSLFNPTDDNGTNDLHKNTEHKFPTIPKPENVVIKVSFTTTKDVTGKLDRVKELLARQCPEGRIGDVLEAVLDDYIARHDPREKALRKVKREEKKYDEKKVDTVPTGNRKVPQERFGSEPKNTIKTAASRYIPAKIKHEVFLRDGGRCTYITPQGKRCEASRYLEYDHERPFALGGTSDDVENIRLLCSLHNKLRSQDTFG